MASIGQIVLHRLQDLLKFTVLWCFQNAYEFVAIVHVLEKVEDPSNVEIYFQNCMLK